MTEILLADKKLHYRFSTWLVCVYFKGTEETSKTIWPILSILANLLGVNTKLIDHEQSLPVPAPIDTVNMLFGVVQMRLDLHALLLLFTFSHIENARIYPF